MPDHFLRPMFNPNSIAVVGASGRDGSLGYRATYQALIGGFEGQVYPINPRYGEIQGVKCYPSYDTLPEPAELAVLAVGDRHIEEQLRFAIEHGAKAAAIFTSGYLDEDVEPALKDRLAKIARDAGVTLCGANCMGFVQLETGVRATWFDYDELKPGNIALISHSGIVYRALAGADPRLKFNMVVSPGQELVTTAADFLDYAVSLDSTRVVGLLLETVRDPEGFKRALTKANERKIPVVALKVGQTALSTKLAQSHSGALAGNDAAYSALFDHYGVQRVQDIDEFSATLALLAEYPVLGPGQLASAHDSGGLRGMIIDLADRAGVKFAQISEATTQKLAEVLDYGLPAVNPVDAWNGLDGFEESFEKSLIALADDPDTALSILFTDIIIEDEVWDTFMRIPSAVRAATGKPVALALNWSRSPKADSALPAQLSGIPVIDGAGNAVLAAKHALAYRDFVVRPQVVPPTTPDPAIVRKWRTHLEAGVALDEAQSGQMMADFGIPVAPHAVTETVEDTLRVADELGYPVVLKTAMPGVLHKSDVGGVKANLRDADALRQAHGELTSRLGPRTLVSKMVSGDVELALGVVVDEQFGPLVMVGAGGILIEVLKDRVFLLPPIDKAAADRALSHLKIAPLFDGVRGKAPVDRARLCATIENLGVMAQALGDVLSEVDLNPLLLSKDGCVAVDALVVPKPITHTAIETETIDA